MVNPKQSFKILFEKIVMMSHQFFVTHQLKSENDTQQKFG